MIKNIIYICFLIILIGCNTEQSEKINIQGIKKGNFLNIDECISPVNYENADHFSINNSDSNIDSLIEELTCSKYVVIIDTSYDYNFLRNKMLGLSKETDIRIDTLNRTYFPQYGMIMCCDSSIIYNTGYFPRRYDDISLSLEYYEYYKQGSFFSDKNIALVACITTESIVAENVLSKVKKTEANSFVLKSNIYMGCMY